MYYSNNTIVRSCFNHAIVNVNLCIGAKFAFLRTLGVDIFKHKLCDAIKHVPQSKITVEHIYIIFISYVIQLVHHNMHN